MKTLLPAASLLPVAAMLLAIAPPLVSRAADDYPYTPVPFTDVRIDDAFWSPRLETNRTVTIPYDFRKCEETGRIDNFAKAGDLMEGEFRGNRYDDSDVFKVIEGAAYSLALHPDPDLDRYLDGLIAKIAAAQEEDGYLYTTRTIDPENPARWAGEERWSFLAQSHELYNVGHLYEAAVAHHLATGKRTLLDVALRNANLIDSVFGPEGRRDVPGHEEIEIGLVKLSRLTGNERYLRLARFFVDERGRANGRELYGEYCQDHAPLVEQSEAVGHAVRAGYLYSGAADVAALTGERAYVEALDRIWNDVVSRKLYVTGGIGSSRGGEAFGAPYDLPNAEAYNETCAAIAAAMWNHRMFLLEGDARYLDVLERVLYNGFLAGIGLSGDRFFYPNPLASDGVVRFNQGSAERAPWFGCSCCPVNIVRFLPSLAGSVYALRGDALHVNLFVGNEAEISIEGSRVRVRQETRYPWDGRVTIAIDPEKEGEFAVRVRIPGWSVGRPVPSDLYRYLPSAREEAPPVVLRLNGERIDPEIDRGFAEVRRSWRKGDRLEMDLPMEPRRVVADERVAANRGRVALERGPIVYCLEGADHDAGRVRGIFLPDEAALTAVAAPDLLGGVVLLRAKGGRVVRGEDGKATAARCDVTAIPYHAWCHRGAGEMAVWIPREARPGEAPPLPTTASRARPSASHTWGSDTERALNDQREPRSSADESIPRHTWWDHRGTTEWVQYEFPEPTRVAGVEVYWFDDTGHGGCRVPAKWRVLGRDGDAWKEVTGASDCGVAPDRFNETTFDPVTTTALRLEVTLQPGFSGGILEWRLLP
jgi:DUF1680 family protein